MEAKYLVEHDFMADPAVYVFEGKLTSILPKTVNPEFRRMTIIST